jgi:acetate---CoA ligase (ADP-forming)
VPLQGLHDAAAVMAKWAGHCARVRADAAGEGPPLGALVPHPAAPLAGPARPVNEAESKRRLATFGLRVPEGRTLTPGEMAALPDAFAGPMVLKVLHDDLPHKTEVGGVALNLRSREEVVAAAGRMIDSVARRAPAVHLDRFLLEPMQPPPLAELIVGVKRDPLFGMVLVIGAGGVFVELLKDAVPLLLPVDRAGVEAALRGLKTFALLDGFRGRPAACLEPVVDAIMAISAYAGAHLDTLAELDVNPLMVSEDGAVAVDALIVEVRTASGSGE